MFRNPNDAPGTKSINCLISDGVATISVKYKELIFNVLVDEEDLILFNRKLFINKQKGGKFRVKCGQRDYIHRLILNVIDPKIKVDHINGNPLDNRKSNLRICTNIQNCQNMDKRKTPCASRYKGVWKRNDGRDKCWTAEIRVNTKRVRLGSYYTENEAALVYNKAALLYFGEFAKLNEVKDV